MRMYGRRRQISAEETAANAERKAARERATMTCQCCGRKHLANTGKMAHHGYQRPGGGWQTSSCAGARELPFEVSRDELGKLIKYLNEFKANSVEFRKAVADETMGFMLSYIDYSKPRDKYGRHPQTSFQVTRATFEALTAEHAPNVRHHGLRPWGSFNEAKEKELKIRDFEIKNITDEINYQQKRFDGWKQTHTHFNSIDKIWIKA